MVNSALLLAFIFKIKEERVGAAVENVLKNGSKSTTCGWLFQVQRCERDRFESSKSLSLLLPLLPEKALKHTLEAKLFFCSRS